MKRITGLILICALVISLNGCGFGKKKRSADTQQPKATATQASNPYDQRVRVLQDEIARLKQRMEIVEDKLNGTRGPKPD